MPISFFTTVTTRDRGGSGLRSWTIGTCESGLIIASFKKLFLIRLLAGTNVVYNNLSHFF